MTDSLVAPPTPNFSQAIAIVDWTTVGGGANAQTFLNVNAGDTPPMLSMSLRTGTRLL